MDWLCLSMRYLADLSREHPAMAQDELEQVLAAETDQYEVIGSDSNTGGRNLVLFSTEGQVPFDRLAMTFRVVAIEADAADWSDIVWNSSFNGSFCVRSCSDALPKEVIEQEIGARINEETGNPVDLDDPDVWFGVFQFDDRVYVGREIVSIPRGSFEERRSHHRPFSAPVSLHPEQARALVNLAGVSTDGSLLDPFCGTGGILIEGGMMGCTVYGMDLQDEMVDGTEENLAAFDISGDIVQGNAREGLNQFGSVDAIVTDLPYGKASLSEGSPADVACELAADDRVETCIFVADQSSLCGWEPEFSIYVHKSLSRYIYRRT